ncbi:MAG: molecular chaperone DnaJ [Fimbriimonadaceae bacterium]|nr:molecular chaperone DnaJ [Fimbriimonadaceae bacterium]
MTRTDPYEALGVPREASADEIKSAYRRLARKYHPDVNPGDPSAEEKFKEIGQAYAILSDPEKRARFDRFGSVDDLPDNPFAGGGVQFSDLFDMFFGGGGADFGGSRGRSTAVDGEDLQAHVVLQLADVLQGVEQTVSYRRLRTCADCGGNGAEGGATPDRCTACQGTGMVSQVRNTFIGSVRTTTTCPTCNGRGYTIKNPCRACRATGLVEEQTSTTIRIPPGVETGQTLHVAGRGNEGLRGGHAGDLYVVLNVADDKRFERHGRELVTRLEISIAEAALGAKITVDGLDDDLELDVPAGTQPGEVFTIRGAGLPPLHGGARGNLRVRVSVAIPKKLNDEQRKLLMEFARACGEEPKEPEGGGLLGGLFRRRR